VVTATEARDAAAFAGFMTKIHTGNFAVVESLDAAAFSDGFLEEGGIMGIGLRHGNTGIGVSPEAEWKDGEPRNADGTNIPAAIGQVASTDNFQNLEGVIRQSRLIKAVSDTPAGTDIIPGWFAYVDVKAGQWQWCVSRTVQVADSDNPIGMEDVT
jgi:hypothetical protein